MGNDEIEVEKGPAVAGPGEAQQYVAPLDEAPAEPVKPEPVPADKVFNISDEEIARQAAQTGEAAAQGEHEVGK